jgi:DedD protein
MRIPFLRPKPAIATPERARPAPMGDDPTEVQAARTQARRRLVGAVVLLLIGVVGFPVLFETQPRPLPIDTPIEVPRRDTVATGTTGQYVAPPRLQSLPALPVLPADAGTEETPASAASGSLSASAASRVAPVVVSTAPLAALGAASSPPPRARAPSAVAVQVPAKVLAPASVAASVPALVPAVRPSPQPAPQPAAKPVVVASASAPAAPTEKPLAAAGAAAEAGRFVIQAGAYGEAGKLREARARIEKLGLKTYTQVVETEQGTRTRVRVGPYATRAEADAVAAKVRRSGLPAAILAL